MKIPVAETLVKSMRDLGLDFIWEGEVIQKKSSLEKSFILSMALFLRIVGYRVYGNKTSKRSNTAVVSTSVLYSTDS